MELTFYGARGSHPIARRDQVRYGGNTTCLYIRSNSGRDLIMDGGSGLRLLGNDLMIGDFGKGEGSAVILVGHTHWDHIMGFPYFTPFYRKGNRFEVVSAGTNGAHIREILKGQQSELNFPVAFEHLAADFEFRSFVPGEVVELGDCRLETVQLNHPGTTVGYRIEADGASVTVFTDTARSRMVRLGDGIGPGVDDQEFPSWYLDKLAHCARDTDLLIHDTQYLSYQLVGRYHYGHSSVEDAVEIARMSGARKLALFHFAPENSDVVVDDQLAIARDLAVDDPFEVIAAQEGSRVEITAGRSG